MDDKVIMILDVKKCLIKNIDIDYSTVNQYKSLKFMLVTWISNFLAVYWSPKTWKIRDFSEIIAYYTVYIFFDESGI